VASKEEVASRERRLVSTSERAEKRLSVENCRGAGGYLLQPSLGTIPVAVASWQTSLRGAALFLFLALAITQDFRHGAKGGAPKDPSFPFGLPLVSAVSPAGQRNGG
jgi:hypothetical protein